MSVYVVSSGTVGGPYEWHKARSHVIEVIKAEEFREGLEKIQ